MKRAHFRLIRTTLTRTESEAQRGRRSNSPRVRRSNVAPLLNYRVSRRYADTRIFEGGERFDQSKTHSRAQAAEK